jgi:hypothetical protein
MAALQEKLFAQNQWALLLIFQAMDAAGKDSTIKHVMSGVNPAGLPGLLLQGALAEELDHDFLWRATRACRARADRHLQPLVLRGGAGGPRAPADPRRPALPESLRGRTSGEQRFEDINAYERYLTRNGVAIRKFFLHVSPDEQRQALSRAAGDAGEELEVLGRRPRRARAVEGLHARLRGDDPRHQHEHAPWYVVPPTTSGSRGWSWRARSARRSRVSGCLPEVRPGKAAELAEVRARLVAEAASRRGPRSEPSGAGSPADSAI